MSAQTDIAADLTRILGAKADLKTSIEGKGVTVPAATKIDGYASLVDQIQTGGGAPAPENDVNFYDYDGFRVASFTIAEAKALTQAQYNAILPPAHEGLTFQEWNWSLADIQNHARKYIDIGANYVTNDSKFHIKIDLPDDGITYKIVLNQTVTRSTIIDWGDGSEATVVITNVDQGNAVISHTYAQKGKYDIKIYKTNGTGTFALTDPGNNEVTPSYAYEINLSDEVRATGFQGGYFKVSVPKTLTTFQPKFAYCNVPIMAIPRGSDWKTEAINSFALATYGIVSFPSSVPPNISSQFFAVYDKSRAIIPKLSTTGFCGANTFGGGPIIKALSIPNNLQWSAQAINGQFFGTMYSLVELDVEQGWTPNYNVNFSYSAGLSSQAIVDFFHKLGTTESAVTLTFGTTLLNKLTADEKAIATDKGYTLA